MSPDAISFKSKEVEQRKIDPRMKNYPGPLPAAMYEGVYKNGTWNLTEDWKAWVWTPNNKNGAVCPNETKVGQP